MEKDGEGLYFSLLSSDGGSFFSHLLTSITYPLYPHIAFCVASTQKMESGTGRLI